LSIVPAAIVTLRQKKPHIFSLSHITLLAAELFPWAPAE